MDRILNFKPKLANLRLVFGVIGMLGINSCSSSTVPSTCSVEFRLKEIEEKEVFNFYEALIERLGMQMLGYDRIFPSNERVMVIQAGFTSEIPIFGVMNSEQNDRYILSVYPEDKQFKTFNKVYDKMMSKWSGRINVIHNNCFKNP